MTQLGAIITELKKSVFPVPMSFRNRVELTEDHATFEFNGKQVIFSLADKKEKWNTLNLRIWQMGLIGTTFFDEEYKKLDVEGKDVVDIGSAIGDTAIYFATKGARRVYCYETDKRIAEISRRNIQLNNMEAKITVAEPMSTLKGIIETNNLKDAILKSDCEGCEYELLLKASDEELKVFSQIMLEYHKGYEPLETKLTKAGFKLEYTVKGKEIGMMVAKK